MRRLLPLPLVVLVCGALLSLAAAPVPSPVQGTASEHCETVPEAGPRACASVDAAGIVAAGLCDHAGAPAEACGTARGTVVDPALVDAYEASDLSSLHALQRELGSSLRLARAQVLATHNSYNAQAYLPTVSNQDPNQWYSLTDQLRMDMRAIELDVHTWYGVDGDADGQLPVLCHATGPHLGCSTDRPLAEGLAELRTWLDANPGEVVLVDVEDHLDGAAGHDEAATLVEEHLGDLLLRPPAGQPCAPMPLERSIDDIRAAGAQVLLVSSCGAGEAWGQLVHAYGDWHQGRLDTFDGVGGCGPDYDRETYDSAWTRYWEDTTWLSAMAGGPGPRLDAETTSAVLACGLSQPSFDRLHPQDERLTAALWSWAEGARPMDATLGDEAVIAPDGRIRVHQPSSGGPEAALCRTEEGSFGLVEVPAGLALVDLDEQCGDGDLAVPRSAREMQLVREAVARDLGAEHGRAIRLDYTVTADADGPVWTPDTT